MIAGLGLSEAEASRRLGYSAPSQLNRRLNEGKPAFSREEIERICHAFKLDQETRIELLRLRGDVVIVQPDQGVQVVEAEHLGEQLAPLLGETLRVELGQLPELLSAALRGVLPLDDLRQQFAGSSLISFDSAQTADVSFGNVAGGDVITIGDLQIVLPPHLPQHDPLAAALALLERMPAEAGSPLPDIAPLPLPHRMPLPRNPMFVGRAADLRTLARMLKGEQSVTAIGQIVASTGMGGIGKTNLATEFVHRYGRYFAGGVFWLSFADPNTVPAEAVACGLSGLIDQPGWSDLPLDEQVQLVRRAWQAPIPRLLVFDNCEHEDLIREWRPTSGGCRVLITSRRERWSAALGVAALTLDILPRHESVALLHKHRPALALDDPALGAIAAELGDLPLALHLAGSFLEAYSDDPAAFLAGLRGEPLLEHEALQGVDPTYSPTNHILHVGRTFSLSYERLDPHEAADALARDLLARAACLAPGEPIPRDLLLATVLANQGDQARRRAALRGVERICAVGLMESVGDLGLKMHRLVRWFVERTGDMEVARLPAGGLRRLVRRFVKRPGHTHTARDDVERAILEQAQRLFTKPDTATTLACQAHFGAVVDAALQGKRELAVELCNAIGLCFGAMGAFSSAQHLFEQTLGILDATGQENSDERAVTLHNLAGVLWDQGAYQQAQAYLEETVRLDEARHGSDHPTTATSLNALAAVIQDQGDYGSARPLLERALAIRERALGPDHPHTAVSLNNVANLLQQSGDYAGARPLYERALVIQECALGPDHPDTSHSLNNLALLLNHIGDYAAARPLLERALAIRERALGPDHPDTAVSLMSLAELLRQNGDYDAARPLLERAMAICERALGPDHPNTALGLNNLALVLANQGDFQAAIPLLERALTIQRHMLGPEHPHTIRMERNLEDLRRAAGQP